MGNSESTPKHTDQMAAEVPTMALPDFNHLFNNEIPKMMQVADDMHRMTDYIRDLRNMTFGLIILSAVGALIFVFLKWRNEKKNSSDGKRPKLISSEYATFSRSCHSSSNYPQKPNSAWRYPRTSHLDQSVNHQDGATKIGFTEDDQSSMISDHPIIKNL